MAKKESKDTKITTGFLSKFAYKNRPILKTGILALDLILGGGRKPGKVIEFASASGLGKSTIMMYNVKYELKNNQRVLYIDSEEGVDENMLMKMDLFKYIDSGQLNIVTIHTYRELQLVIDEALGIEPELKAPLYDVIIIDSIAMVGVGRQKGDIDRSVANNMLGARYLTTFLQQYKGEFGRRDVTCWLLNHLRNKTTFMGNVTKKSAGADIIEYGPDIRIKMKKKEILKREEMTVNGPQKVPYGAYVNLYTDKARTTRPEILVPALVIYGYGVNNAKTVYDILKSQGFLTVGKSGYHELSLYGIKEKIHGEVATCEYIRDNINSIVELLENNNKLNLVLSDANENVMSNFEYDTEDEIEEMEE